MNPSTPMSRRESAARVPVVLACACWLALTMGLAPVAAADVIDTNYAADGSFHRGGGYLVGTYETAHGVVGREVAVSFATPGSAAFTLDTIDVAIAMLGGLNVMDVFLTTDTAGHPGDVIEQFHFVDAMQCSFCTSEPVRTLIAESQLHPVLHAGTTYWLLARGGFDVNAAWQLNSIGRTGGALHATGPAAESPYWNYTATATAFRVTGTRVSPLREFVTNLYDRVLGRAPDPAGLAGWEAYLESECNATGFAAATTTFFDSPEFRLMRRLSIADLVRSIYGAVLKRAPDPVGFAGWSNELKARRLTVPLTGFIPSAEFRALLPNRADATAINALITRFYREILGRDPEFAGLTGWVNYVVASGDLEGTAVAFLGSEEFDARALTFRDYVTILYRAFLGREPEAAGLDGWEAVLRAHLLAVINGGFVPSAEFAQWMAASCG